MMSRRRGAARLLWIAALGLAGAAFARPAAAQTLVMTITASGPDSISPAPTISIHADNVPPELQPARIRLQISSGTPCQSPFLVLQADGNSADFTLNALLPSQQVVFICGQLLDRNGNARATQVDTARVRSWLRMESPTARATTVLFTRTPTFTWSSPGVTLPPGPWQYSYAVVNAATGAPAFSKPVYFEQSFTPQTPLEACTAYRFILTARAQNGPPEDSIRVNPGTFVIQTPECPQITLLYQNFPNPFGAGTRSNQTCLWFDLAHRSSVKLSIYTISLHEVRRLVPGTVLDSGAYGRGAVDASGVGAGCDPAFSWDGRDDAGRSVPPGAYIAVFDADGHHDTKKILYRGP